MPVQYTNRKGKIYFLHEGSTKKGNPKYTLSQSKEGALNIIPEGYEIYENPNAQVFLRRIKPKLIKKTEEILVKEKFIKLIEQKYCKLTVEKKTITIYLADQDVEKIREIWKNTPRAQKEGVEVLIDKEITYSPVIQLVLQSQKERLFVVKIVYYEEGNRMWEIVNTSDRLEYLIPIISEEIDVETYYSFPF